MKIRTKIINGVEYFTSEGFADVKKAIAEMQNEKRKQHAFNRRAASLLFYIWTTILPIATTYTQLTGGFKNEIFFWFFSAYFLWRYYEFEYDKN